MIIIGGSSLYGRVDKVPGLFHVATQFAHIFWLPVIPLGSIIILEENAHGYRGVKYGLSGRSVLAAYLRSWPLLAAVGLLTAAGLILTDGGAGRAAAVLAGLAGIGMLAAGLAAHGLWATASEERFHKLCARLEVDPDELLADVEAEAQAADAQARAQADENATELDAVTSALADLQAQSPPARPAKILDDDRNPYAAG
jgi:hypothetical protein